MPLRSETVDDLSQGARPHLHQPSPDLRHQLRQHRPDDRPFPGAGRPNDHQFPANLIRHQSIRSQQRLQILARLERPDKQDEPLRPALRRGLPVGLIWGDKEGEVHVRPDEAVTSAIRAVFTRFAEVGSARQVWYEPGRTFSDRS